jgi:type I restriction enzyme S subunit
MEGFTEAVQEIGYQGIRKDDLVVHSMDGFAGAIGVSDSDGKASPVVHAYRVRNAFDSRFIAYFLRTMALSGYIESLAKGIRERSTSFDAATLANLLLPCPSLDEQRRIADFLDAETTRIDAAVTLIMRQGQVFDQRYQATIDAAIGQYDKLIPLKYTASIVDTEHKTAPTVPGGGYWIAGTSAVRRGRIDHQALYETDEPSFREWTSRRRPQPGDVLLSREAPVGEVGLYRQNDPHLAIGQRMVLLSPQPKLVSSEFLAWTLLSSRTRRFIDDVTQGSLHPHLNMSDIGSILVDDIPLPVQEGIAAQIGATIGELERLNELRAAQLGLLAERRQAVITAAVTGEITV